MHTRLAFAIVYPLLCNAESFIDKKKKKKKLKEIQNLRDENVLTADEFQAEKDTILQTLRDLK